MEESGASKFVLEAFPRNDETVFEWEATLAHQSWIDLVLFLEVRDDTLAKGRLFDRGFKEDTWEYVQQRYDAFDNAVLPVAKYYYYMGDHPFAKIVTDNKSVDDVWTEVKEAMSLYGLNDGQRKSKQNVTPSVETKHVDNSNHH